MHGLRSLDLLLMDLYHPKFMRPPTGRIVCPPLRPWEPVAPGMLMMAPVVVHGSFCLLTVCPLGTALQGSNGFHQHRAISGSHLFDLGAPSLSFLCSSLLLILPRYAVSSRSMCLTVTDLRSFQESPTDGDIQVLKWTVICGVFALHSSLTKDDEVRRI